MSNNFLEYELEGIPVVKIGVLKLDDLGTEALRIHNERFKGIKFLEFPANRVIGPGEEVPFVNLLRTLSLDGIIRTLTRGQIRIINAEDCVRYLDHMGNDGRKYSFVNSVVVYPRKEPNGHIRQNVLRILGREIREIDQPLLVSGLGLERENNGFRVVTTDYTVVKELPYLNTSNLPNVNPPEENIYVVFDPIKGIKKARDGKRVSITKDRSGLRGVRLSQKKVSFGEEYITETTKWFRTFLIQDKITFHEDVEYDC